MDKETSTSTSAGSVSDLPAGPEVPSSDIAADTSGAPPEARPETSESTPSDTTIVRDTHEAPTSTPTPTLPGSGSPTPEEPLPHSSPVPSPTAPREIPTVPHFIIGLLLLKARMTIQLRKRKMPEKIMILFLKKKVFSNSDFEKLLHVSYRTATRYLGQLVKEWKISPSQKRWSGRTYTII
jgi:hypothetical protein